MKLVWKTQRRQLKRITLVTAVHLHSTNGRRVVTETV